jgi:hypothetical protein
MRPETFHAKDLVRLLKEQKIATLPELKAALGTEVDSTVFRKLRELSYLTSYSHRGRYYTLQEIPRFDDLGLWWFRSVGFSKYGTLVATVETLVESSEAGYSAAELEGMLLVSVKAPARKLVQGGRLVRQEVAGRYLYLSVQPTRSNEQRRRRRVYEAEPGALGLGAPVVPDELRAAIVLFYSLLDEKQRRLYAGLESAKIGHGGDQQIADLVGVDPSTIARGRRELLTGDVEVERIRREGGGRKSAKKNA